MRVLGVFAIAAAAAAVCIADAAGAETFSGTAFFDESGMAVIDGPLVSTPGAYVYSFAFDVPLYGQLDLQETWTYDFYDAVDNAYQGGNDVQTLFSLEFYDAAVTSGSLSYVLRAPYEVSSPPSSLERGAYKLDFARLTLYQPQVATRGYEATARGGVNYTFSVNTLRGGVPEPASWAMMIAGFGAAGLRLRRRQAGAAA